MPISITKGTLVRVYEDPTSGMLNAVVAWTLSNGFMTEINHTNLPISAIQAVAKTAGRVGYYLKDDIVAYLVSRPEFADLAPAVVSIATPSAPIPPAV